MVMMAGRPQATRWNHWDCASMASCPHFREADRNQHAVSITHLHSKQNHGYNQSCGSGSRSMEIHKKCTLSPHYPSSLPSGTKWIYFVPLPPPPPIRPFVQNNLEINSDMNSALDRPPVHKFTNKLGYLTSRRLLYLHVSCPITYLKYNFSSKNSSFCDFEVLLRSGSGSALVWLPGSGYV